jgi:hypothetical protein
MCNKSSSIRQHQLSIDAVANTNTSLVESSAVCSLYRDNEFDPPHRPMSALDLEYSSGSQT